MGSAGFSSSDTARPHRIAAELPSDWLTHPPANLWLGVTVESPDYLWRVFQLRDVRVAVRFISYEPALARVCWEPVLSGIHWLIAGGESGNGARSPQIEWFREARDACAYAGVAEVSVYVAEGCRGRGVGRALLDALVAASERRGIWTLQAGIFPENMASVALHERCGFRVVGRRERLGRLAGTWRDVLLLERRSDVTGL